MKRRARRVTIGAAVLGFGVIGILVAVHWGTVLDHVEAWSFQLSRRTETITPLVGQRSLGERELFYYLLAHRSGCPVIFDPADDHAALSTFPDDLTLRLHGDDDGIQRLEASGWRVLEQRFPRKAYVVIHRGHVEPSAAVLMGPNSAPRGPLAGQSPPRGAR